MKYVWILLCTLTFSPLAAAQTEFEVGFKLEVVWNEMTYEVMVSEQDLAQLESLHQGQQALWVRRVCELNHDPRDALPQVSDATLIFSSDDRNYQITRKWWFRFLTLQSHGIEVRLVVSERNIERFTNQHFSDAVFNLVFNREPKLLQDGFASYESRFFDLAWVWANDPVLSRSDRLLNLLAFVDINWAHPSEPITDLDLISRAGRLDPRDLRTLESDLSSIRGYEPRFEAMTRFLADFEATEELPKSAELEAVAVMEATGGRSELFSPAEILTELSWGRSNPEAFKHALITDPDYRARFGVDFTKDLAKMDFATIQARILGEHARRASRR